MSDIPKQQRLDLRARMTRKMIVEAMLSLMEHRKFDQISVADICGQATVHRTTFYKHFEDKFHLMRYIIEDLYSRYHEILMDSVPFETPAQYYCALIL